MKYLGKNNDNLDLVTKQQSQQIVHSIMDGHTHTKTDITDFPTSMPASDVYNWAKQENKPTYTYSEVGAAQDIHTHTKSQITDFSHTHQNEDLTGIANWAKEANKPTYTYTEVGAAASSHTHLSADITDKDSTPTANSNKVITSGAVYTELLKKLSLLDTAGFHNSIVRGKNITSYFTDGSLWDRINGTNGYKLFEDLYLGDYFNMGVEVTVQGSYGGTTGSQYVTIAGFDTHYGNGSASDVNFHHICVVPGQYRSGKFHFGRRAMNTSSTTEGGYVGSNMHSTILGPVASTGKTYAAGGTINEQLYNIFGSHLKTTNELLSNSLNATGYNRYGTNSGCTNNWSLTNCQAVLMSEVELYGSIVWSSSGFDTGNANNQLPLFKFEKACINNRSSYYWLKDVASATSFASVYYYGNATYSIASGSDIYVRPRCLLS